MGNEQRISELKAEIKALEKAQQEESDSRRAEQEIRRALKEDEIALKYLPNIPGMYIFETDEGSYEAYEVYWLLTSGVWVRQPPESVEAEREMWSKEYGDELRYPAKYTYVNYLHCHYVASPNQISNVWLYVNTDETPQSRVFSVQEQRWGKYSDFRKG